MNMLTDIAKYLNKTGATDLRFIIYSQILFDLIIKKPRKLCH